MNKKQRIEVWFRDGLFRAFPNVERSTVKIIDGTMCFNFGNNHEAIIYESAINFIEIMDQEESAESHN